MAPRRLRGAVGCAACAVVAAVAAHACQSGEPVGPPVLPIDAPRPLGPALGPTGVGAPLLGWLPSPGAAHYEVEIAACAAGAVATCSFAVPATVHEAVDTTRWQAPLLVPGRYAWRVRACGDGCSAWSRPRWIDVGRVAADIDGDGKSDVVAGAPLLDLGGTDRGSVLVVPGSGRLARIDEPAGADGAVLGAAITCADLDGDGRADLVVGAPGHGGGAGRAYLYRGPDLGASGRAGRAAPTPALVLDAPGAGADDWLGAAVTSADFDGDGYVDVAVAAPGADGSRPGEVDVGRVVVWRGAVTGIDPSPPRILWPPEPSPYDGFGSALSAGDLDGDGYSDLVIGAGGIERAGAQRGVDRGAVFIYRGSSDGLYQAPSIRLEAPSPSDHDRFGYAVSTGGDLDGDLRPDLAIGAPSTEAGAPDSGTVYLYTGVGALAGAAPRAVLASLPGGPTPFRRFGSAVAIVGDVDGDGLSELAVGTSGPERGLALLYRGRREGVGIVPWAVLRDPTPQDASDFGDSIGAAGDVDGDGHADVVIGAASAHLADHRTGSILVYRGTATGVAEPRTIEGPAEPAHFGRTLAGR